MSFRPIASYGFIGNLGSCALVNLDGGIDWCCLPYLDSPSVFGAILDIEKGGTFRVAPEGVVRAVRQAYIPDTNILQTHFTTDRGTMELTDWMHAGPDLEEQDLHHLPAVFRRARCTSGMVDVRILFEPRFDYGRALPTLRTCEGGCIASSDDDILRLAATCPIQVHARHASAVKTLHAGETIDIVCDYGSGNAPPDFDASLRDTAAYWATWTGHCDGTACTFSGDIRGSVIRSSIVLKVLAGGNTRGIAAAATTSLPEIIGAGDNWDYRFSWIRDTSFTIQALTSMGHLTDARVFLDWMTELLSKTGKRPSDLQVLYPLRPSSSTTEEELSHLCGYKNSRPVRIGNGAADQRQLDIYGEILDTVFRSEHLHPKVEDALATVLADIVEHVCGIWNNPDHGIWEFRSEPLHYTYSRVMCWVAIDRGIRLATEHGWKADIGRWKKEADAIRADVMERGYSEERQSFVQSYDSNVLDATALLFPLLEFIKPDHPKAIATLNTLHRELVKNGLVYRSDERSGKEGAFGLCGFWLVDALAVAGRLAEAEELFANLVKHANHVGLYSEEIDPVTGDFLGNFPQAFTHVGLINSAMYLARLRGQQPATPPLMGEQLLQPHLGLPQSETRTTIADVLDPDAAQLVKR